MSKDGAFKLDVVYAFGHIDPKPLTAFVNLSMDGRSLELSPLHFVPIYSGECQSPPFLLPGTQINPERLHPQAFRSATVPMHAHQCT